MPGAVAVVGVEQQAHLRDRSAQACHRKAQVGVHIRRAVQPQGGGATVIRARAAGVDVRIRHRYERHRIS